MMIPIRATFKRADKPGGRAEMIDAVYADVPMELVMGALAKAGESYARRKGDEDSADKIHRAIDRAEADGKLITMTPY